MSNRFDFSFSDRKENGDDHLNLSISFENPQSSSEVANKLQTFLNAAGYGNIEVIVSTAREEDFLFETVKDLEYEI